MSNSFEQNKMELESELVFLYKYYYNKAVLKKNIELQKQKLEVTKRAYNIISTVDDDSVNDTMQIYNCFDEREKTKFNEIIKDYINCVLDENKMALEYLDYDPDYRWRSRPTIKNCLCGSTHNEIYYVERIYEKKKKIFPFLSNRYSIVEKRYTILDTKTSNIISRIKALEESGLISEEYLFDKREVFEYSARQYVFVTPMCRHFDYNKINEIKKASTPKIVKIERSIKHKNISFKVAKMFEKYNWSSTWKSCYYDFFGIEVDDHSFESRLTDKKYDESYPLFYEGRMGLYTTMKLCKLLGQNFGSIFFDSNLKSYEDIKNKISQKILVQLHPIEKFMADNNIKTIDKKKIVENKLNESGIYGASKVNKSSESKIKKGIRVMEEQLKELNAIKSSRKLEVIPLLYQTPEAIAKMAFLYSNKRADTIKELINLYEETEWRNKMLNTINNLTSSLQVFADGVARRLDSLIGNQIMQNRKLDEIKNIELMNATHLQKVAFGIAKLDQSMNDVRKAVQDIDLNVEVSTSVYLR